MLRDAGCSHVIVGHSERRGHGESNADVQDKALAAYDELSTTAPNQQLKEMALLLGAEVLVDKGDVAGVKQRVQGLAAPDNPLHNSAREALGLKAGDKISVVVRPGRVLLLEKPRKYRDAIRGMGAGKFPADYLREERRSWR